MIRSTNLAPILSRLSTSAHRTHRTTHGHSPRNMTRHPSCRTLSTMRRRRLSGLAFSSAPCMRVFQTSKGKVAWGQRLNVACFTATITRTHHPRNHARDAAGRHQLGPAQPGVQFGLGLVDQPVPMRMRRERAAPFEEAAGRLVSAVSWGSRLPSSLPHTHAQKYGPYASSRITVAEYPRYSPRRPPLRRMPNVTVSTFGLRCGGSDCCRILTSSMGHVNVLLSAALSVRSGARQRRHSRRDDTTPRASEADLAQRRVKPFLRNLCVHEALVRCEHDAIDLALASARE